MNFNTMTLKTTSIAGKNVFDNGRRLEFWAATMNLNVFFEYEKSHYTVARNRASALMLKTFDPFSKRERRQIDVLGSL